MSARPLYVFRQYIYGPQHESFLKHFSLEQEELHILTNHHSLICCAGAGTIEYRLALGEPSAVWRNVNHFAIPNRLQDLS